MSRRKDGLKSRLALGDGWMDGWMSKNADLQETLCDDTLSLQRCMRVESLSGDIRFVELIHQPGH